MIVGEFELVNVVFQLDKFDPTKAEAEIKRLIGPQGNVVVLPTTRQISVTETAGAPARSARSSNASKIPPGCSPGSSKSTNSKIWCPTKPCR